MKMNGSRPVGEIQCPSCGYRLAGLPEARCPECGAEFRLKQVVEFGEGPSRSWIIPSCALLAIVPPFGALLLVFSIKAMNANSRHDFVTAKRHGRTAGRWCVAILILALGLVTWSSV